MFTAIKLFFGTSAGWVTLGLMAALCLGAYGYGRTAGYASGHSSGFSGGQESRNKEVEALTLKVTTLTDMVNKKREAETKKIDEVEVAATDAAIATVNKLNKQITERDKLIANYEKRTPIVVQEKCGLSIETVEAINQLIDNANDSTQPTPAVTNSSTSADPADPDAYLLGHTSASVATLQESQQ